MCSRAGQGDGGQGRPGVGKERGRVPCCRASLALSLPAIRTHRAARARPPNPPAGFAAGDVITGRGPWSTFAVLSADDLKAWRAVPRELLGKVPLSYFLGTLGERSEIFFETEE